MIRRRKRRMRKKRSAGRKGTTHSSSSSGKSCYKYGSAKHRCYRRSTLLDKIVSHVQQVRPDSFRTGKRKLIFCTEDECAELEDGPSRYTIYCIVNTSYFANKGNLIASVARGFLKLFNKVEANRVKSRLLDVWEESGEKLVILDGINHRHLKYLGEELHYAAVATHALKQDWGKSQLMLVLSAFGKEEDLEEWLGGLDYLR